MTNHCGTERMKMTPINPQQLARRTMPEVNRTKHDQDMPTIAKEAARQRAHDAHGDKQHAPKEGCK